MAEKVQYTIEINSEGNATENVSELEKTLKGLSDDVKKGNIGKNVSEQMAQIEQAFDELDMCYEQARQNLKILQDRMADPSSTEKEKQAITGEISVYSSLKSTIESTADELEQYRSHLESSASTAGSARARMREMREELIRMREAGQEGTQAYRELADQLARLTDIQGDVSTEAKRLSSDQGALQGVIGGMNAMAAALSVAQGTVGLFSGESEKLQKVMLKVQSIMAITIGLSQIENALNKDGAFRLNVINPLKARYNAILSRQAAAQAAANTATTAGSKALNRLKAAMLSIPGIGWILAIATAMAAATAAIVKVTGETKRFVEAQKQANELEKAHNEYIRKSSEPRTEQFGKEIEAAKRRLDIMKAENAPLEEQEALHGKILEAESVRANWEKGYYGASEKRLKEINKELASLYELQEQLTGSNDRKVVFEGRKIKREEATDIVEGRITNLENRKKQYNDVIKASEDAEVAITRNLAEQAEKRKEISRREYAARMQTESMKLAAMDGGYARDRAELRFAAQQQKDALYLTIGDENSTQAQRDEAAKQVKLVDAKLYKDLAALKRNHDKEILALQREHEDNMLSAFGDTADAQRQALKTKYARMREDLQAEIDAAKAAGDTAKQSANEQLLADTKAMEAKESAELEMRLERDVLSFRISCVEKNKELAKEGSRELFNYEIQLLNLQMEDEIAANRQKVSEMQEDEQAIRDRYAAKRLKATNSQAVAEAKERLLLSQANRQAEEKAWEKSERAKNILSLELQLETLEETLRLNDAYNQQMSEAEIQETRNTINETKQQLALLKKQTSTWDILEDALGISVSDDLRGRIKSGIDFLKDAMKDAVDDLAGIGVISEEAAKNIGNAVSTIENVVSGIATGASVGGVIGAAVGGVVSLGSSLTKIVTDNVKELDELYKKSKEIAKEVAELLKQAQSNSAFGATANDWSEYLDLLGRIKKAGADMIKAQNEASDAEGFKLMYEAQKAYEELLIEAEGKLSNIFGGLGDDLLAILTDTTRSADEAFADLTDNVAGYIRQWVAQMLYADRVAKVIQEEQRKINAAQATGDTGAVQLQITESIRTLLSFAEQLKADRAVYDLLVDEALSAAGLSGYSGASSTGSASGMSGTVSGMSAETASLLAGQLTAMRLNAANIDSAMQQTLYHVSGIHADTGQMAADIAEIKNGIKYNQRTNAY